MRDFDSEIDDSIFDNFKQSVLSEIVEAQLKEGLYDDAENTINNFDIPAADKALLYIHSSIQGAELFAKTFHGSRKPDQASMR